ncbi:MAG: V-type ATP synthase subunit C [bacterium]|nr:V-type ATP synthase subunit C [bacterium]
MLIRYPHIESKDTRYAYAVARIRALETRLLSTHKVARLFEAKDGNKLLRALQDTGYSQWLNFPQDSAKDYESIVRNARIELYSLMAKLILDSNFVEILKLKYDYHNVKTLLKGMIGEKEVDALLSNFGNISTHELKSVFQNERYDKLGFGLQSAIEEAISNYYLTKDPRFIDIVLDKAYYSFLIGVVGNIFLNTLIKIEIDLVNIKILLRIKWLKEERGFFTKAFIDGGWLEQARFLDSFDEPIEAIPHYFKNTPYSRILTEGVESLISKASFLRLEKLCDDHFISFCRATKYLAFGVEPVLAYFYGKENEFKILRMIFTGKINAIPDTVIRERLPEAY